MQVQAAAHTFVFKQQENRLPRPARAGNPATCVQAQMMDKIFRSREDVEHETCASVHETQALDRDLTLSPYQDIQIMKYCL